MEIGATESLRLLTDATRLMFGASSFPRTQAARDAVLYTGDGFAHLYRWQQLDALARQFCEDRDGLEERVEKFANDHALRTDFLPRIQSPLVRWLRLLLPTAH